MPWVPPSLTQLEGAKENIHVSSPKKRGCKRAMYQCVLGSPFLLPTPTPAASARLMLSQGSGLLTKESC